MRPKTYSATRAVIFSVSGYPAALTDNLSLVETARLAKCHGAHEPLEVRHTNSVTCSLGRDMEIALQKVLLETSSLDIFFDSISNCCLWSCSFFKGESQKAALVSPI